MAERLEHTPELAPGLYAALGHPRVDPHGERIPQAGDASVTDPSVE